PLLFWPGIVGTFMGFLPKTVIVVLMSSLFVALVISPVLCATLMKIKPSHGNTLVHEGPLARAYGHVLAFVLANRGVALLIGATALVTIVIAFYGWPPNDPVYPGWGAGSEFFPSSEPRRCRVNIKTSEGALLERTDSITRQVEARLVDFSDIDYVTTNVGTGGGNILMRGSAASNRATVAIEFVGREERSQSSELTVRQIRDAVGDVPGAIIEVKKEQEGPPTGESVEIELSGERVDILGTLLPEVYARIKDTPGLVDLKDDFVASRPEIQFPVDRNRAALFGMSTNWVAQFIKMYVQGIDVGKYREGEDEYEIYLRADKQYRYDLMKLMSQYVPDAQGNMVPLSSLASMRFVGGYGTIQRVDQKRAITITGSNAEGYNARAVLADVKERLGDLLMPAGCRLRFRGQDEESEKAGAFLGRAMIFALMLIACLLITQFNSITQPFIIMVAVIMSLVGVFGGLLATGLPFSIIMTGIGVIGLAGVVVNNGIVLIAYTKQLEATGMDTYTAIMRAGKTRLRPVLLTAMTTMLGLLPMAIGVSFNIHDATWDINSESSQWWRNMAISVMSGLGVATLLTLLVEPALYSLFCRAGKGSGEDASAETLQPLIESDEP
ncbi:MAG TPA: efflux RND transporter permease subunit, partial [Planctomycetota bacterium]|nr:efflux RND transporter permease subunit [Planctomycetota bacterium]